MRTTASRRGKSLATELSRRTVLAGAAAIAAATLPAAPLRVAAQSAARAETAILALIRHREAAIALGTAVLSSRPDLGDRNALLANMLDDLGMDGESATRAGLADIATRLSARIRDDFANGRTLMLDGWLLSSAETRLYALAALAAK